MNKLFSKIASLSIGLALAIGVGVAVGSKEAKLAKADTEESATIVVGDIASANSWANESQHSSWDLNSDISISTAGTGNNGKYYTSNSSWRLYEANNGALTLTGATGVTLSSVKFTYANGNNGRLYKGSTKYASGTTITISGSSYSFDGVTHNSGTKSGNIQITQIEIHYTKASSDTLNSINLAATSKGTTALESATVKTDKTLQVYLTANYSSSGAVDKTDDATWTATAGTGTASVTKGLITGLTVGTVTISASYGGKDAVSLTLTVTQGPKVTLSRAQFTPFLEKQSDNSTTISTTGFSGTVAYSASSNSANLTASIVNTNHVQIVAANNIPSDETVTVTVTGDDGNDTASAELKVYLKAPVFTLSGTELSVKPGASSTITVTTNYFLSDVTITAPSGAPSKFSTSVSGSTITITGIEEGSGSITVTATDGTITRTGTISVTVADVLEYELVTDDSTLTADSQLIIASTVSNNSYAMGAQSSSLRSSVSVTIADSKISGPSSDVKIVTLEGEAGAWYLKVDDGYLSYSGSSNNISTSATKGSACTWTISISSNNATIRPSSATTRLLSYNSSQPRFCVYGSVQNNIQLYGILAADKEVTNTRLTTTGGSITASVGASDWTVSGFVFEVQYDNDTSKWYEVSPTYTVTESVPTSYSSIGSYPVHFKVTFKDVDYNTNTPFTATVTDDMTPISSFYDGTITVGTSATSSAYTYRGTVIAIEGNTYYIQDGDYGIMVYGGNVTYPTGMKIGDLVAVTSKIINYNGYVIESNSITTVDGKTCRILGDGVLPSAPIVTTVSDFNSANQSTRITFNGLSRSDSGTSITWTQSWAQGNSGAHGIAKVQDGSGTEIWLYVSKYLDSTTGNAIVTKINSITTDDTFDLFQGVKAINTTDFSSVGGPAKGVAYLSVMSADNITIHTPEEDHVQTWIDLYMQMDNPAFDGDGTGACRDSNYYVNAKAALNVLEEEHSGSKEAFQTESKYADALERYLKWAKACGDSQPFVGTTIQNAKISSILNIAGANSSTTIIVVVISAISVAAIGGYFFFRKKKED